MLLTASRLHRAAAPLLAVGLAVWSMAAGPADFRLALPPLPTMQPIQGASDPVVTSVTPATLTRGQAYTLMLSGRNLNSRIRILLGEGMDVGMPMVTGTAMAQVSVSVRPGAPLGPHAVILVNGNQRQTGPASVTVVDSGQAPVSTIGTTMPGSQPSAIGVAVPGAPPPLLAMPGLAAPAAKLGGLVPSQWQAGQAYTLSLNGSGFAAGMQLDFGEGVESVSQTVFNPSLAQVRIEVDAQAKAGQRPIRLRTGASQAWQSTGLAGWVVSPTRPRVSVEKPRPKLVRITPDIAFKKGVVELDAPDRYVPLDLGAYKDTAFLLHDALVFKWHEKNPGTADFYEFRILSLSGKLLMKKRLEAKLLGNYLPPPNYYQPDAAFLDALLNPDAGPAQSASAAGAQRGGLQVNNQVSVQATSTGPQGSASNAVTAAGLGYPPGTDLLWEVAGYRVFNSDGVAPSVRRAEAAQSLRVAAAPSQIISDAPQMPGLPGLSGSGVQAVEKPEPVELEVEISERWPLRRPNRPNGFGACPLDGQKSQLHVENRDRGKGETLVSAVNYVGDELLITGQVDLTASPYTSHPEETAYNPPPSTPPQSAPQPGSSGSMPYLDVNLGPTQVTDHQFGNLFVDWGDGVVVPMTLKAGAVGEQSGHPFDRSEVMQVPDSQAYAEQQAGNPSPYPQFFTHQYGTPQTYTIRVYQLSEHDVQHVNPAELDGAYRAGQGSGPYFRVRQANGMTAAPAAGKDIADRAYVLYCREVKIEPYEDPVAYGALWLKEVEIVGFGAPKASQTGSVAISARKTAQPASASAAKARLGTGAQPTAKTGMSVSQASPALAGAVLSGGVDAVCSGCNKAFTAHAVLSYFGTGDIQAEWKVRLQSARGPVKSFANTLAGSGPRHVPASPAREGNPKEWGDPEPGRFDLYSPPLPVDPASVYEVWVEVKLAPKPLVLSDLGALHSFRNGLAPAAQPAVSGRARQPKLGILRPFKEAAKGAPPVLYVDNAGLSAAARKLGMQSGWAGKLDMKADSGLVGKLLPASVASSHKKYRVTAIDPSKPCEFAFPGQDGDRFRVFLDNQDIPQDSSGAYSGSGTLDLKLASGNGAAAAIPVGIDFQGWKVDPSGNVAAGTTLKRTVDLPVAPTGLNGTLVRLDGVAGQRMDATLDVDAADSLFRKQGGNEAIHWQATAALRESGDWTAKGAVGLAALGWTGFYLESPEVTLDISNAEGSRPGAACSGPAGAGWTGVHLGQAKVEVNTMDLATVKVPVNDWGIANGVCGKLDLVNDPSLKNLTVGKGTVSFNRIRFEAAGGKMAADYNFDAHLPWLDVDLHADEVPLVPRENAFDFAGVTPAGNVSRSFGPIRMDVAKSSFRFGTDAGGWRAITEPHFTFKAEGKDFLASPLTVPDMRFGMNGRAWFDDQAASSRDIPLSGTASLGKTQFDLTSVSLVGGAGSDERLVARFQGKLNLSKALPAADVQVDYRISGEQYAGSGPFSAPFTIKTAFPPGQPTAEATIAPVYAPTSGQQTRYLGSVDLGLFGGPPIKGEFLLGYQGSEDYWLTRVNVPLGSGVPLVPPFLTLYQIRGGLGYNMALDAFKDAGSLENAQSSIGKGALFMAGMRVGAPDRFAYMLDGDFTVSPGAGGGRMDFRAWLLKNQQSGNGDFQGYFQYAGGNFDGRLWGHLGMLNDAIAFDLGDSESNAAVDLHVGGGWYLYAGKKAGPRIRAKVIASDSDSYLMLGSDVGLAVGGGQHYYLGVGSSSVASAYVKGYMDVGMQITPQPHAAGDFGAGAEAGVCVAGGCESMGVNAAVHAEALPVTVRAHATVEFPWPLPDVSFDVHM